MVRVLGIGPSRWAHPWHLETDDKRHGLDVYPDDPRGVFEIDLREESVRAEYRALGLTEVEERYEATPFGVSFRYSAELCRGGDIGPKREGVTRIVTVGDSFTEGQGVPEASTFSAVLDELGGPSREVLNCGRRGYDVSDVAGFFERQLVLEPDLVVYAYTLNDPEQSEAFAARQTFLDDWILDRRRMFTDGAGELPFWRPRLWTLLTDRIEGAKVADETTRWYQEMVQEPNAAGWLETQRLIEGMHETMQARGGRLLVAVQPLFVNLDGDYPFESVHQTVTEALRDRGVWVVDLLDAFRDMDATVLWVHPADRHPNEYAHRMIAEAIDDAL
jgi:lysophospholipase L1-like esterase